jgi:hypothetical protein
MAVMTRKEATLTALLLLLASAVLYAFDFVARRDGLVELQYGLDNLAFLPLEVLFVTLLLDRVFAEREKRTRRDKMNMVIGTFFSAVGQRLLEFMGRLLADDSAVRDHLALDPTWGDAQMREAMRFVEGAKLRAFPDPEVLEPLRDLLSTQRDFMLRLLENPILLEHEAFTDVLWAVFHLEEELVARKSLRGLPEADLAHLAIDTERACTRLLLQWLAYMIHLRQAYPFLFSFLARTNPLRPGARAEIADPPEPATM